MSKRKQVVEDLTNVLSQHLPVSVQYEACREIAEGVVAAFEQMTAKKPKKGQSDGARVWDVYEAEYVRKYGFAPPRNAVSNNQCAQLVHRLGFDDAVKVVQFYLTRTDSYYMRTMHQIGVCLKDSGPLFAQMKAGRTLSRKAADKIESAGATLDASSSYLNRKYNGSEKGPKEDEDEQPPAP